MKNEDDVFALLEPLGFERVVLGGMTVADQFALFRSAFVVVSPHGAGMANMIFSGTGTKFIEFLPRSYAHPMFGHVAKWSGHWYGRIVLDDDANNDMRVDLALLRDVLKSAGV